MNKVIKEQLEKVQVADLSNYHDGCNEFIIPKAKIIKFNVGDNYLIELDDSLLKHNPDSLLESNYNNNRIPTSKYYSIEVSAVLGKTIKCVGVAFDKETKKPNITSFWNGYLPIDCIKIVKEEDL